MDEVADGIFIGSYEDAMDEDAIRARGITTVINLSKRDSPATDQAVRHVPLDDSATVDGEQFKEAVDAALTAHEDGPVLIHCNMGVSRSTAVAATVIAIEKEKELRDVLRNIEQERPQANPHPALVEQAQQLLEERRS
ncbi:MAG: dual specificity protein phosphatase [Candidatus Nanohaloarchaea archaeon]|nr:dual specificity protein phosphatase [Candidatus Nanohaloarchaea archaeon]